MSPSQHMSARITLPDKKNPIARPGQSIQTPDDRERDLTTAYGLIRQIARRACSEQEKGGMPSPDSYSAEQEDGTDAVITASRILIRGVLCAG